MIIAEYTIDHPFLRRTLRDVPGIELAWEDSYTGPDGAPRMIAWIESGDFEAVEAALADDQTVANATVLTEVGGRRLYRFDMVGTSADTSLMPVMVEVGGVLQAATATAEGWRNRTRFPDREAFERVYRFCRDHEIDFTFGRIYERSDLFEPDAPELTAAQRETLIEAVDSGYLDIPRGSSLRALGERLGISESAASERFRRGAKKLIQQTIYRTR